MIKLIRAFVLLMLVITLNACKSAKAITGTKGGFSRVTSGQLISAHIAAKSKFKTLQSKIKVAYKNGDNDLMQTVTLRIEKDKTIWLSAGALGIVGARAKITPQKVQFYKRFPNEYFNGDFSLLSKLLGTEVDFEKLQNLLLGESLYNLKATDYKVSAKQNLYRLQPKKQNVMFDLVLFLNPKNFKVNHLEVSQPLKSRALNIKYAAYSVLEMQHIPKDIKIIAQESADTTTINMQFKSTTLNEPLRFPFKIPDGFKEIIITDE